MTQENNLEQNREASYEEEDGVELPERNRGFEHSHFSSGSSQPPSPSDHQQFHNSPDHIVMNRARSHSSPHEKEIEHTMRGICGTPFMTNTVASYGDSIGLALDTIVVLPQHQLDEQPMNTSTRSICQDDLNANENQNESGRGIIASSEFLVRFPSQPLTNNNNNNKSNEDDRIDNNYQYQIIVQINGNNLHESFLSMALPISPKNKNNTTKTRNTTEGGSMCYFIQGNSTKPSTDVLEQLVKQKILTPGRNLIRYILVRVTANANSRTIHENQTEDYGTETEQQPRPEPQANDIIVTGDKRLDGRIYKPIGHAEAYCFLWSVHDKVVISDIDGTVTKSDTRGAIDSIVTEKYDHVHDGVCELFSELVQYQDYGKDVVVDPCEKKESEGPSQSLSTSTSTATATARGQVRVLYLSSRPMKLIKATRKFLSLVSQSQVQVEKDENGEEKSTVSMSSRSRRLMSSMPCMGQGVADSIVSSSSSSHNNSNILQEDIGFRLPPGPVFIHPGTISTVFMMELIKKTSHEYKADTLARQVVIPFAAAGKMTCSRSPLFVAGFGNKRNDLLAYEMAGVSCENIYIINKKSELVSTVKTWDDEDGGVPVPMACCNVLETLSPIHDSNTISVSNPDKNSNSSSTRTRTFQGYKDPLLRLELLQRLRSY